MTENYNGNYEYYPETKKPETELEKLTRQLEYSPWKKLESRGEKSAKALRTEMQERAEMMLCA